MKIHPNFSLKHTETSDFVQSQWQTYSKSSRFLVFRWLLAVYFFVIAVFSLRMMHGEFSQWCVFLAHWSLTFSMVTTFFGAILTTLHHYDAIKMSMQTNLSQTYWFLTNISTVLAFVNTVFYYEILYSFNSSKRGSLTIQYLTINTFCKINSRLTT
jgi:hypothetical protein